MSEKTATVEDVIDGRREVYGDPKTTFPRVAEVWSGILGTEVRPDQVPLLLMGYKLVRASDCPTYSDNSDDVEGYLDIFRTVVGEDMIHARTVSEYLEIRDRRRDTFVIPDDEPEQEAAAAGPRFGELRAQPVLTMLNGKHSALCGAWNDSRPGQPFECQCAWAAGQSRLPVADPGGLF